MNYGANQETENNTEQTKIYIPPVNDGSGQPLLKATNKNQSIWVRFFKNYPTLAPIVVGGVAIGVLIGGVALYASLSSDGDNCTFGRKAINVDASADGFVPVFTENDILDCKFYNGEPGSVYLKNNATNVQLKFFDSLINLNVSMQQYVLEKFGQIIGNMSVSSNQNAEIVFSAPFKEVIDESGDYTYTHIHQTVNVFKDTMMNTAQKAAHFFGIKF